MSRFLKTKGLPVIAGDLIVRNRPDGALGGVIQSLASQLALDTTHVVLARELRKSFGSILACKDQCAHYSHSNEAARRSVRSIISP